MSSLTSKEKLKALGVSAPAVQNNPYLSEFEAIEEYGFSQFQTDVSGQASYSEFDTYLVDTIGLSSTKATQFRSRMEQKYTDFSDFQTTLSGFSNIDGWINSFSWGTTIGGDATTDDGSTVAGGIRVHNEAGVTYDGENIPAGGLELFGSEIHTSQSGASSTKASSFATTNLQASNTTPDVFEDVIYTADITNNNSFEDTASAKLTENGEVVATKTVSIGGTSTKQVAFTRRYEEVQSVDVKINEAGPVEVQVIPEEL